MTNRTTTRRATYGSPKLDASRASLLFGTALGVSIAIFAASPQKAWAADECGADVAGTATCTSAGNPYPTGIDYVSDAGENITVVLDGTVDVITPTDDGVTATNGNAGFYAEIDIAAGAVITTAQDGAAVISVGVGSDGYVYNDGEINAGTRGVFVYAVDNAYISNDGSVYVDGDLNASGYAHGLIANGVTSSEIVNTGDVTVVSSADTYVTGIWAYQANSASVTSSGAVDVTANSAGSIIAGIASNGVTDSTVVTTTGGTIDVVNNGAGAAYGVSVDALAGSGTVSVGDDISVTAVGGSATGIDVTATTTIDIDVTGEIYTDVDNTTGNNYGISAITGADVTDAIDIDVTGDIITQDGATAMGVFASGGGAISIDVAGSISVVQGADGVDYGWGVYAINTGGSSITINVDDVSVDQAGSFLFGGGDGINAYTVGATDITAEDVSTTGYYADGIRVGGAAGIGGDTDIDVVSVTTTGYGSDGIDVGAANGFIDVTATGAITTTGTANASGLELNAGENIIVNVNTVSTDGTASDGIYAFAQTGVDITAGGLIDTDGANSSGIEAYTISGLIDIDVTSIDTDADGSLGIDAYNQTGNIDITSTGLIDTAGAGSTGIYAYAAAGTVTIDAADVISNGAGADGIYAYGNAGVTIGADNVTTTGGAGGSYAIEADTDVFDATAGVTINVTGNLSATSTGGFAEGVDVYAGGDVSITVGGDIDAVSTAGAYGVFAVSYYGDVDVAVGDVDVTAVTGGAGIDVFAGGFDGTGNATVTAGDINVTGAGVEGVSVDAIFGSATVDVGNVTSAGAGSEGLDVYGYLDVDVTAGNISTTGVSSDGVYAYSFLGNVTVDVLDVTTTGDAAYGIYAYAFFGSTEVTADDVNTSGAGSTGIYAYGFGTAEVTADTVTTTGAAAQGIDVVGFAGGTVTANLVDTTGDNSTAITVVSATGPVDIDSGVIDTTGDNSDGIVGVSFGDDDTDDVTITSDAITTAGLSSDGIVAYSDDGDIIIDSGAIGTLGDDAFGIYAYSYSGATVDVTSDAITTAGVGSLGIYAYAYFGEAIVDSGSVITTGDGSTGIYAYGFLGATVTSDTVSTAGAGAIGIEARSLFSPVSVDSGSVTTTGDGSIGILAFGYGGTTVISDTVSTDGLGSEGIVALDILGPVSVTSGDVDTLGDYSNGIRAGSYYDVTVDSGTVETSGDSSIGIYAYSVGGPVLGDGSVDITFDSVVTNGDAPLAFTTPYAGGAFYYYGVASHGIVADAGTGEVSVVGGDVTTNGAGASGIIASGFGDVYVNVDDVTTTGPALIYYDGPVVTTYYSSAGINASVAGGDVTVIADTVTTSGYGAAGIVAVGNAYYDSLGTPTFYGDTLVSVNSVVTNGDYADGIVATNAGGNTSVYVGSVTTFGDGSDGIVAVANGYYDSQGVQVLYGDVNVEAGSVTTYGANAYGIYAAAASGDVFVDVGSVTTTGDGAIGIYAAAFNYYDSSAGAEQNLHGDVFVEADVVSTGGDFATGIVGYAEGGNVNIYAGSVTTSGDFAAGIVATAGYYGIDPVLLTYYSGDANVFAANVSTYGDSSDGIVATAEGGNVRVYAGNVYAGGLDSDAIVAVTGGLDVNNSDDVYVETTGAIYSFDGIGISISSAGGAAVDIDSGSVFGYDWGVQSASVDGTYVDNDGYIYGGEGRAIDINGGAADIANAGVILGFVDLTDNDDYFYNNGLWEAYGTSSFGLGSDEVVNEGTVGFSRYQGAASTTTFASLEFFSNYGTVSGVDDQVGDVLNISGNFFGGAGSELDLDVALGGPGSTADRLVIGSASGVTLIDPNDTLSGLPGVLNFGGILVVDSANPAETGTEFVMDNVDKGFVEYELIFDAATDNWLIVGLPDDEAFEMLTVMTASQDFWRRSGDALTARWQEIRDASPSGAAAAGPGGLGRSDGWELWMQTHAGVDGYENLGEFSVGGFTFNQDLSTTSDWRGFQFGFDNLSGNTLWGLTMGFTQQETNLDATSNSFDVEGWNVGGYAGWASNGFFLNGLVKGDFYSVDGNFKTLPSFFEFDGVTWGVQGELGYRWEGESMFFEPVASLAWTTTDLDRVTTAGATIDFDDADSLRAKAGARIGGTFGDGNVVLTPYVGVYWVDELEGENGMTFTTGPTSFSINDTARGDHGLVDFGFTTQTFYGLEGFVKGEWNFGGDADGGGVRLGARWRW